MPASREVLPEGKNEDEVDVSCVQLSADWRSILEDSGGEGKSSMCKMVRFQFDFC